MCPWASCVTSKNYGAPAYETGPVGPVAPVPLDSPAGPVGPVSPCGPVAPVFVASPAGPVGPVSPVGPVDPLNAYPTTYWNVSASEPAKMESYVQEKTSPVSVYSDVMRNTEKIAGVTASAA